MARIFDAGIDFGIDDSIPQQGSSLTTWERICGKSRSSSGTKTSASLCATHVGYEQTRQTAEALRQALSETGESSRSWIAASVGAPEGARIFRGV
jgi:hypothetical protein